MKAIKIGLGLIVGLFLLVFLVNLLPGPSIESQRRDKDECARALTSSIDAPVRTYADKVAYDAVVRDKCKGMTINGKPVAP